MINRRKNQWLFTYKKIKFNKVLKTYRNVSFVDKEIYNK